MASQILTARAHIDRLAFVIHLDTTKTVPDPANQGATIPDPRWLLYRDWPIPADWAGRSAQARGTFLLAIKAELQAAAAAQIATLTDQDSGGTPLAIEGATF